MNSFRSRQTRKKPRGRARSEVGGRPAQTGAGTGTGVNKEGRPSARFQLGKQRDATSQRRWRPERSGKTTPPLPTGTGSGGHVTPAALYGAGCATAEAEAPGAMFDWSRAWNLSLAGCGFSSVYHLGALSCFLDRVPRLVHGASRICGASSGCLVAAAATLGLPLGESCRAGTAQRSSEVRGQSGKREVTRRRLVNNRACVCE